jgi:hypothetical protein
MLSFLIDKFQDTTNNLNNIFLLETSSQSQQDAFEIFEKALEITESSFAPFIYHPFIFYYLLFAL